MENKKFVVQGLHNDVDELEAALNHPPQHTGGNARYLYRVHTITECPGYYTIIWVLDHA